jgi:preprotein translocase subunit YajC
MDLEIVTPYFSLSLTLLPVVVGYIIYYILNRRQRDK